MSKPKVLILGKLPPPYMGPAVATKILLNSDLKNQYKLIHLNTKANESLSSLGKWSILKVLKNIARIVNLKWLLLWHCPRLVLIPISQSTLGFVKDSFFILTSRFFLRKTLLHLRGSNFRNWLDSASGFTRAYVRFVLKRTQGVIVLGSNLKYLFEDYYPADQIFVVPNGADYNFPQVMQNTVPRILYLSNFRRSKGFMEVLQATELLKDYSFELKAAGEWVEKDFQKACEQYISENSMEISFSPPVTGHKKLELFANADIFVFTPNKPEGHPWVIIEAMAAGLPIVSTDQGAITESVIDGENGFIVDTNNPQQLAGKLKMLLESSDLRTRMGEKGRVLYKANFTEEKMVAKMKLVCDTVIGQ